MTDTTHEATDDLMTRLKDRLKALYDDPREYSPGQISEASGMALTCIEEMQAKLAKAVDALRPFAFLDNVTTQEAWEIRYRDRFEDWIDYGDIDRARATLAEIKGTNT